MPLDQFCTVAEACQIAGVSKGYLCALIRAGRIKAERVGVAYLVHRDSVARFERQPGMGRPPKAPARPAARRRRKSRK